jgi:hypothetical protein
MPINWTEKVNDAVTNLETKIARVLEPGRALAVIDDIVVGKLAAADLAAVHGIPRQWVSATLGHVTRAVQSGGRGRPLAEGGWYEFKSDGQPYEVAAGFAAAWKKARSLP